MQPSFLTRDLAHALNVQKASEIKIKSTKGDDYQIIGQEISNIGSLILTRDLAHALNLQKPGESMINSKIKSMKRVEKMRNSPDLLSLNPHRR